MGTLDERLASFFQGITTMTGKLIRSNDKLVSSYAVWNRLNRDIAK